MRGIAVLIAICVFGGWLIVLLVPTNPDLPTREVRIVIAICLLSGWLTFSLQSGGPHKVAEALKSNPFRTCAAIAGRVIIFVVIAMIVWMYVAVVNSVG